jgi:hypothetical protein
LREIKAAYETYYAGPDPGLEADSLATTEGSDADRTTVEYLLAAAGLNAPQGSQVVVQQELRPEDYVTV